MNDVPEQTRAHRLRRSSLHGTYGWLDTKIVFKKTLGCCCLCEISTDYKLNINCSNQSIPDSYNLWFGLWPTNDRNEILLRGLLHQSDENIVGAIGSAQRGAHWYKLLYSIGMSKSKNNSHRQIDLAFNGRRAQTIHFSTHQEVHTRSTAARSLANKTAFLSVHAIRKHQFVTRLSFQSAGFVRQFWPTADAAAWRMEWTRQLISVCYLNSFSYVKSQTWVWHNYRDRHIRKRTMYTVHQCSIAIADATMSWRKSY